MGTVVLFLSLCYPPLSIVRPFDELYERALSDLEASEQLFEVIPKLAKFAHWCDAPAVLDRLQYVVVQLKNKSAFRYSESFYVAFFALEDVGRVTPYDTSNDVKVIECFPHIFIELDDEKRNRFAGHALRMFQSFLGRPMFQVLKKGSDDQSSYEFRICDRLAKVTGLARYLLKFHPGPRRSVATQTDDAPVKQLWSQ